MVDSLRNEAEEVLLGIAVGIDKDAVFNAHGKRSDVAGRNNDLDAFIQCAEQRGLEAAAAGSGDADALAIDVGAREQVVDGAHSVPDFPPRQIGAGEVGEIAHDSVFGADQVVAALLCLRIPELASLALADGVPADDEIAALHQPLAKILDSEFFRFAECPAARERRGELCSSILGHIDERRDIEAGKALVDELLDMKAVGLECVR